MWTLVQSSSSSRNTPPPPRTHSLPTRQQRRQQHRQRQRNDSDRERNKILKGKKVKEAKQAVKKKKEGTDCYLLLMRVFLGIFSRHFLLIGFIYMQIYNFSLCKELKDNHSDVIL